MHFFEKMVIKECLSAEEIKATFPIMYQLRSKLIEEQYVDLINELKGIQGYRLIGLFDEKTHQCYAVAGFKKMLRLYTGGKLELYVDDLVTDARHRSKGCGKILIGWLKEECKRLGCVGLVLDSGVQRKEAHLFYKREGMRITSLRFYRDCSPSPVHEAEGANVSNVRKEPVNNSV